MRKYSIKVIATVENLNRHHESSLIDRFIFHMTIDAHLVIGLVEFSVP